MKQITRILALSALVLVALFAARTLVLPSNELNISFPESETESSLSAEAERPAAPVLTAAADVGLVTITWQPVADAATYEIWMRHSDIAWQQLDDGSLTATSFTHTEFTSAATYSYTGRSVSASGLKSSWASQVHAAVSETLAAPVLNATAGPGQISLRLAARDRRRQLRTLGLGRRRRLAGPRRWLPDRYLLHPFRAYLRQHLLLHESRLVRRRRTGSMVRARSRHRNRCHGIARADRHPRFQTRSPSVGSR